MSIAIQKYYMTALILSTLAALLITGSPSAHDGESPPYVRRTPYYVVTTDISMDFTSMVARHMDALYKEYEQRFSKYKYQKPEKATIYVFRKRDRYDFAVPKPLRGSTGCFIAESNVLMSFLGDRTREDVLRTLYHEGFHQFLYDRIGGNMPLWLNEGFAEYFAEATWDGDGFRTGLKPVNRLYTLRNAIQSNSHIPFSRLVRMGNSQWVARLQADSDRADLQYSQAWSVIHFLLHARDGEYAGRLSDFLKAHADGKSHAEAFKQSFGKNIRSMERAWKAYVMSLRPDPLSLCRHNMHVLIALTDVVCRSPQKLDNMDDFAERLLHDHDADWAFNDPCGPKIRAGDNERLEAILQCPEDPCRNYILRHDPETGMPQLFCTRHQGLLIRAGMVRRDARWRPETEVLSADMLPGGLLSESEHDE